MPLGKANMANLRRSAASNAGSWLAWVDVDEHTSNTGAFTAAHISSMALAMSTL